jgi:hypothetical protein
VAQAVEGAVLGRRVHCRHDFAGARRDTRRGATFFRILSQGRAG